MGGGDWEGGEVRQLISDDLIRLDGNYWPKPRHQISRQPTPMPTHSSSLPRNRLSQFLY